MRVQLSSAERELIGELVHALDKLLIVVEAEDSINNIYYGPHERNSAHVEVVELARSAIQNWRAR